MTPTKLLIGQALVIFVIVIGGVWAATQWSAAMLGNQPRLGLPWFDLRGWPIYYPWRLFEWWYADEAYEPWVFERAGILAAYSGRLGRSEERRVGKGCGRTCKTRGWTDL